MKKIYLILTASLIFCSLVFPQKKLVYVGYIDGEIDLGLAPYISRFISDAEDANADAIIFKINTFGGRVDAATQIKDVILSTNIPTVAFINNRAISAGALIALSCDQIFMVPGSSIGAATVVDQSGSKVGEKYQSYMRSEMRSTAEKTGRRTDIAEGMVDERVVVSGLVDSTQLITLTSKEALKYEISNGTFESLDDVLAELELSDAELIKEESNWAEDVVRFLNNPIISSILLMIGFFGLFAEVKTPGWGVPGTAGLVALVLFFGSSYILELASIVEILMFVAGVILLAVEVFAIPGFGIAGISGIILIIASLFLSLLGDTRFIDFEDVSIAIMQISVALLLSLALIFLLAKYLPKSSLFNRLILAESETADKGFLSYPIKIELMGKEGVALTTLRPAGTAKIDGKRVDVVTDSEYLQQGTKIKVIGVDGMKVVVTAVEEEETNEDKA